MVKDIRSVRMANGRLNFTLSISLTLVAGVLLWVSNKALLAASEVYSTYKTDYTTVDKRITAIENTMATKGETRDAQYHDLMDRMDRIENKQDNLMTFLVEHPNSGRGGVR